MIKLTEWHFVKRQFKERREGYFIAEGFVTNHPKLQDGIYIHTSIIQKLEMDAKNNRLLMHTYSQNIYELLLADMNVQNFENIQECLQCFNVPAFSLSDCRKMKDENEKALNRMVNEILQQNEFYLQMSGVFVQKAFFKNCSNELREMTVYAHIGMYQDSYIIADFTKGEVDFRYWDGANSIKPYHWSDGLETILINNKGSKDIDFVGSKRIIICKVGDITRIESKEYCGEGLLSPDVVNGKCVLFDREELDE